MPLVNLTKVSGFIYLSFMGGEKPLCRNVFSLLFVGETSEGFGNVTKLIALDTNFTIIWGPF